MKAVSFFYGSATRIVALTYGFLVGLAGIEHGIFETLQGNIIPKERMINAIGESNKFWEGASERAITIIPNIYITGIIAIILGICMVIWSIGFIHKKSGGWILLILSIALFLTGGGMAPVTMGIIAGIIATRINNPVQWIEKWFGKRIHGIIAATWPWTLIVTVLIFLMTVEITIFGWFFGIKDPQTLLSILWTLAIPMIIFIIFSAISSLAYDSKNEI